MRDFNDFVCCKLNASLHIHTYCASCYWRNMKANENSRRNRLRYKYLKCETCKSMAQYYLNGKRMQTHDIFAEFYSYATTSNRVSSTSTTHYVCDVYTMQNVQFIYVCIGRYTHHTCAVEHEIYCMTP